MKKIFCPMSIILAMAGTFLAAPGWTQVPLVLPLNAVNMPAGAISSLTPQTYQIPTQQIGTGYLPAFQPLSAGRYQFTKIRINHYDAGMMADLITRLDGIIVMPPNFVIPANAAVPASASAAAGTPLKAAPNVLPEGVRRIFVLESDNSLVIEATPEGLASLSL